MISFVRSGTPHLTKSTSPYDRPCHDQDYPRLNDVYPSKRSKHTAAGVAVIQAQHVQSENRVQTPTTIKACFKDVERPMLMRIKALEDKFAVEDPERCVRDVEATGACFFLCGNLARQDCGRSPRTSNDVQLREAADSDRIDVIALMLQKQDLPMRDGDTLLTKMGLAALGPFPGDPPPRAHALVTGQRVISSGCSVRGRFRRDGQQLPELHG